MPTLTDLFNIRVGPYRRAVFIQPRSDGYEVLIGQERQTGRESATGKRYQGVSVAELLREEGISKESVYYVLPPRSYYRNRLTLPFQDRQKIESVLPYEVRDYLPELDLDCVTDFTSQGGEVLAFSAQREFIGGLLEELQEYRENLRGVIPYDHAVYLAMRSLVSDESFLLLNVQDEEVYLQQVHEQQLLCGVHAVCAAGNGDPCSRMGSFFSELRMLMRREGRGTVYLAVPGGWLPSGEPAADGELVRCLESVLQEGGAVWRRVSPGGIPSLALLGGLCWAQRPQTERVNLLKDEFRPRPRGYVSVKEFSIAGGLLLLLLILSTVGLVMDIRFHREKAVELEEGMRRITGRAFGEQMVEVSDARQRVRELRERIDAVERSTDPSTSSLRLLRELALYFPGDVAVEYSDIIVEKERIRLEGKARAFSDIDKIERELLMSDSFSGVTVVNTGTSGSTGGFTVTFVMDIAVQGKERK